MLHELLHRLAAGERHLAGQQKIKGTAQAIQVGPAIDRVRVERLLRRDVIQAADNRRRIEHQIIRGFGIRQTGDVAEIRFLRLPDVVDHRTGSSDCGRLARKAEAIERCRTELLVQNPCGIIGIEQPVVHRRPGDSVIEPGNLFF